MEHRLNGCGHQGGVDDAEFLAPCCARMREHARSPTITLRAPLRSGSPPSGRRLDVAAPDPPRCLAPQERIRGTVALAATPRDD